MAGDVDIPRMRKGLVGGQFWSVYVSWYATFIYLHVLIYFEQSS